MGMSPTQFNEKIKDPNSQENKTLVAEISTHIIQMTELVKFLTLTAYKLEQIREKEIEELIAKRSALDTQWTQDQMDRIVEDAKKTAASPEDLEKMKQALERLEREIAYFEKLEKDQNNCLDSYNKGLNKYIEELPDSKATIKKILDNIPSELQIDGKPINKTEFEEHLKKAIQEEELQNGSLSERLKKEQAKAQKTTDQGHPDCSRYLDANRIKQIASEYHFNIQIRVVAKAERRDKLTPREYNNLRLGKYAPLGRCISEATKPPENDDRRLVELNGNLRNAQVIGNELSQSVDKAANARKLRDELLAEMRHHGQEFKSSGPS